MSMLADTGVRRPELAAVRIGDIDLRASTIRVRGKGAKERWVIYWPSRDVLLSEYLPHNTGGGWPFDLGVWGIQFMLKRLARRTDIKYNAHAFRRTCACESVKNGMNLFYVQSLLGPKSLIMTRLYAEQVNSEDAIKASKPSVT